MSSRSRLVDLGDNQYTLMSIMYLGALILTTVGTVLASLLLGYIYIRFTPVIASSSSYDEASLASLVSLGIAWLILLVSSVVILPRERKALNVGQYKSLVSSFVLTVLALLTATIASSIGVAQVERVLTVDYQIVRNIFGALLGIALLSMFWMIIAGGFVIHTAKQGPEARTEAIKTRDDARTERYNAEAKRQQERLNKYTTRKKFVTEMRERYPQYPEFA